MSFFKNFFATRYENLGAAEFKKKMQETPDAVLIDVRTPEEVAEGAIKGAKNINIFDPNFANKIAALDKNKTYFVYCRSGGRSGQACNAMADMGFEKLVNLSGGYMGWR
jgi:rhodanese-related sulfurtransferase